jgi:hypothetical protein
MIMDDGLTDVKDLHAIAAKDLCHGTGDAGSIRPGDIYKDDTFHRFSPVDCIWL